MKDYSSATIRWFVLFSIFVWHHHWGVLSQIWNLGGILKIPAPTMCKEWSSTVKVPCPPSTPHIFLPHTVPLLGPCSALEPTPMAGRWCISVSYRAIYTLQEDLRHASKEMSTSVPNYPTQPSSITYSSSGLKEEFTSFVQNLDCTLSTEVENASFTSKCQADFSHVLIYHAKFCCFICNIMAHVNLQIESVKS